MLLHIQQEVTVGYKRLETFKEWKLNDPTAHLIYNLSYHLE